MSFSSGCKKIFHASIFLAGAAFSAQSSANLDNSDFSAGLNGWGGDVTYFDIVNLVDVNDYNVNFADYGDNFASQPNQVTLTTSADANNEYWAIYLFQEFEVAANSEALSLELSSFLDNSIDDAAFVNLVDDNGNLIHDFMLDGLSADISALVGNTVSLELGVEDGSFTYGDTLTVSNIAISYTSVPEPSSFAIFALVLLALKHQSRARKLKRSSILENKNGYF